MSLRTNTLAILFAGLGTIAMSQPSYAKSNTIVTISPGDTLSAIADAHSTTYVRIYNANDKLTSPDIINAGDTVRIPSADEELPDRYSEYAASLVTAPVAAPAAQSAPAVTTYAAPAQSTAPTTAAPTSAAAPVYAASSAGNTYAWGNCTWYVKNRRPSLPNMLGNGGQWAASASRLGYSVGSAPAPGAVAEQPGHVAYVESVNTDGTVNISEMNYAGGLGVVHYRTVPASTFTYIY